MTFDPIVRARFWDLAHDAGSNDAAAAPIRVGEAVVAFPVAYGGVSGDYTAHMYADDPVYTAFGREVMGWPLKHGKVVVGRPGPGLGLQGGVTVSAHLERDDLTIMTASLTLTEPLPGAERPTELPRWLTMKLVPRAEGSGDALRQLLQTGPERVDWGPIWRASGELHFSGGPNDELGAFAPREIVAAQYWSTVDLSIGFGRILLDEGTALGTRRL